MTKEPHNEKNFKGSNRPFRVIISGGGTGGHIFPAISIANAIKKLDASAEILFVGAEGRMEMEKVPAAGYKIIGLSVAGFQRKKIYKNVSVLIKLVRSLLKAKKIVKDFNPNIAVGVGGYASGPLLWAASNLKVPVVIQEQNSYAGITNKLLAKKSKKIFVAYEGMEKYFPKDKIVVTGNPVRQGLEQWNTFRSEAFEYFGLNKNKTTILSIGGSLGARTLNQSISGSLKLIGESDVQFIWQSGKYYYTEASKQLENSGYTNIKLYDFISHMDLAYAATDVVISRAGASSISELCIVAKPAILIPSPNVAEDHQTKNALALVAKNAAVIIKDVDASKTLIDAALKLAKDKERCAVLSENIAKLALLNAAENIAKEIIKIGMENVL